MVYRTSGMSVGIVSRPDDSLSKHVSNLAASETDIFPLRESFSAVQNQMHVVMNVVVVVLLRCIRGVFR